ncbi:MAG: hypothetical protein WAT12_01370 [Candidatus Nitrotoga sp.]
MLINTLPAALNKINQPGGRDGRCWPEIIGTPIEKSNMALIMPTPEEDAQITAAALTDPDTGGRTGRQKR